MKKSELKLLIREVVEEAYEGSQEYMLYENRTQESIGFGTIDYIAELLSDYITRGHPKKLPIRGDEKSVMQVIRDYNVKHKFSLGLLKHVK